MELERAPERYRQFEQRHHRWLVPLVAQRRVRHIRCLGTMAAFEVEAGRTDRLPQSRWPADPAPLPGPGRLPQAPGQRRLPAAPLGTSDTQLEHCYRVLTAALQALD